MARRTGVEHTVRVPADGGVTPNSYLPEITARIQVHFPPDTDHQDVARAVLEAARQMLGKLEADGGWLMLAPVGIGP